MPTDRWRTRNKTVQTRYSVNICFRTVRSIEWISVRLVHIEYTRKPYNGTPRFYPSAQTFYDFFVFFRYLSAHRSEFCKKINLKQYGRVLKRNTVYGISGRVYSRRKKNGKNPAGMAIRTSIKSIRYERDYKFVFIRMKKKNVNK